MPISITLPFLQSKVCQPFLDTISKLTLLMDRFAKGGHSKSGVSVDSIYMKIEFEDDPGNVYKNQCHERIRFIKDEYK